MIIDKIDIKLLPKTDAAFDALMASDAKWFVRDEEDFNALLESPLNPLRRLDSDTIEAFRKSLVFKKGGLAHAEYGMLINELTYPEFASLWGYFGMSMCLFEDHKDQRCASAGTCTYSLNSTCTSNC